MNSTLKKYLGQSVSPAVLAIAGMALVGATAVGAQEQTAQSAGPVKLGPVKVGGEVAAEPTYKAKASSSVKLRAPLVDTPKTVTIISGDLIEERGATSLSEILRTTPGITLGSGEGGTPIGDRPFIRGYEASTDIFIDGMRDLGRTTHEAFNVESIEVVKGPASTYSGRGSTGGSLNIISKKPTEQNAYAGTVQGGTDETFRGTIDLNHRVSDTVAVRLNAMGHQADVAGRDAIEVKRWGVAPSVTFGIGTPTRVTLSYYHMRTDDIPDLGIPFSDAGNAGRVIVPDVDRSNFYGYVDRDFRKVSSDLATINIEHDFSDTITLRNASRYSRTLNDYIVTRPSFAAGGEAAGVVSTAYRSSIRHSEALFNQTDLYGSFVLGGFEHNFVGGVEISRERLKSASYAGTTDTNGTHDLLNPDPYLPAPGGVYTPGNYGNPNTTTTKSAYLFDTIKLNEQFQVNAGVRFDHYDIDVVTNSRIDKMWNFNVGLIYKPMEQGSIYVSYGTSSNPAGETAGQSGGADGAAGGGFRDLAPEKSRSLELGTKWELFDDQLLLTAAVFETRKTNARTQDAVTGEVTIDGSNRVRGLELGVVGNITPEFQVSANYTYLDPKITEYRNSGVDFDGNVMKYVAKQNFGLWATYSVLPELTIGGGANYTGKRYLNDANTFYFGSYWRFDATAAYQLTDNIELRLNVLNLTNKTYYDASHVGLFANVAPGRSGLLTASFRY